MKIHELKTDRMLCWDDFLIDSIDGAEVRMHKPVKRNLIFTADHEWEGNCCGYARYIKVGDKYRLYYRGANILCREDGSMDYKNGVIAVCESDDGINFKRMPINKHKYNGITDNNIIYDNDEDRDNFAVFYDENPACPPEEKFKALSMGHPSEPRGHGLYLYVSPDGFDFTFKEILPINGTFDSYNVLLWDKETQQYYIFYRSERDTENNEIEFDVVAKVRSIFRTVCVSTSKDLKTFEHHGEIQYGENKEPMELYTNQIFKYYRAKDMFLGMPARYIDHYREEENFEQMPLAERHAYMSKHWNREGTVATDMALMTSRDGYNFNRWDEAYLTPGIEARNNWWYGECYCAYGIQETPSDVEGAPNEISFIMGEEYRINPVKYYRYTTRLDGFFSWYAKYAGGEILTKPFTFEGNELEINFSSSAFGSIIINICDENGNELEGYKSIKIFGDSVDRKVKFEKQLSELQGKPIRLKINLKDCDLYSFKFN